MKRLVSTCIATVIIATVINSTLVSTVAKHVPFGSASFVSMWCVHCIEAAEALCYQLLTALWI